MTTNHISSLLIVGGGTAGWIAAAALSKMLGSSVSITLVESEEIGTVGVGEATIPQIRRLNGVLGFDEDEFVRETSATFKLGIEFNNWGQLGDSYLHTFGDPGINLGGVHFHQYWLRYRAEGGTESLWDYSLHHKAAYTHKFGRMERVGNTSMTGLAYAFHFDAGRYAAYLRKAAEANGVRRIEGKVADVEVNSETGHLTSIKLEDGQKISSELFIDCTGFRGLLIGKALGVDYEDWSKWLPCNRAWAVASESAGDWLPYTKATAHDAGWQWRIPLQHRTGNGHVFCNSFTDEEAAQKTLLSNLDTKAIADPRLLKFVTGRRKKFWHKNCVSLGLASGFLEPLESTSIHLIQSNVSRLIELFPTNAFDESHETEYNRQVGHEYELIRDFLILHYHLTQRDDAEFWRYCANMSVPDSLQQKMTLAEEAGLLYKDAEDLFRESSWVQVMFGQGLMPKSYHARAKQLSSEQLNRFMGDVKGLIAKATSSLPNHRDFVEAHCKAEAQ